MAGPSRTGDVIAGKYRVERTLGAGGMGLVVEATHLTLDEKVAIKFLKPEALENSAAVARFAREARAAARIKSEHVCRVLDVLVDDGMPYLVMEYLEGQDLDELVRKAGPLPVEDGIDYVLQACEALAEAHVAGVVHRDLKPANLHVSRRADGSPVIKVLDFGISKVQPKPGSSDAAMTKTSSLLGSPLYMSPEQMKATRDVDARTDIWSVGVILYEILTGARPFNGDTIPTICAMILSEPPAPLSGRVPREVEAVILKCLKKTPDERYQSVAELAEALRPLAPARSILSVDRVIRVIGSASSGALKAPSARGAPASEPRVLEKSAAWSSPTVEASAEMALPLSQPARTGGAAAGTHHTFEAKIPERAPRVGRLVLLGGASLAAIGVAALLVLPLASKQRGNATSEPSAAAQLAVPTSSNASSAPGPTPLPTAAPSQVPNPSPAADAVSAKAAPQAAASSATSPASAKPARPPPPPPPKPPAPPVAAPKPAPSAPATTPPKPGNKFGGFD